MTSLPSEVKTHPLRALRVGMTQSNMSTPCATPSTRSSGVPTPIRYRGLAPGSRCGVRALMGSISFLGLPDADAADGIARETHLHQRRQRFLAQVLEHSALHDAEQRIGILQPRE